MQGQADSEVRRLQKEIRSKQLELDSWLARLPSIAVIGTGRMGALRMHGIKG